MSKANCTNVNWCIKNDSTGMGNNRPGVTRRTFLNLKTLPNGTGNNTADSP